MGVNPLAFNSIKDYRMSRVDGFIVVLTINFQFHQGLSLPEEVQTQKIEIQEEAFNSIKDYLVTITEVKELSRIDFQFHQGLSMSRN